MAKYSKAAQEKVHEELHEMKEGKLKSGSGKQVTDAKQAIAIALSEARKGGKKVPDNPNEGKTSSSKKSATRKSTATKKNAGKKTPAK